MIVDKPHGNTQRLRALCHPLEPNYARRLCAQCYRKRWYHAEKARDNALKLKYGIDEKKYQEMVLEQDGRCYLCEKKYKKLFVDHNHETGKVRKLLCPGCNTAVGYIEKRKGFWDKLIEYSKLV